MDVFRAALRGEARVIVQVNSAGAVKALLEVFGEATPAIVPTLMGGTALVTGLDALAGGGHRGAIVVPPLRRRVPGAEVSVPAVLSQAGVPVAFASQAGEGSRHLPFLVTHAMRDGLPARDALRALTLVPARMLGVDDRLGSLEHGKDCDCVVLTGDPFDPATRVRAVVIGGAVVFDAAKKK
jgi:imidazolonepropionase-like amidohydrolase